MILVMLRVMALSLWRDRAGLVLVFVLPPLVFIVFASVFSAGATGRLDIRAGVVDLTDSADSRAGPWRDNTSCWRAWRRR